MKHTYEVIVGNIGTVHRGSNRAEAMKHFAEYVGQSESDCGRAAGESVTLWTDGEPSEEFAGERIRPMKALLPTIKDLSALLHSLKSDIGDDSDDGDTPGLLVTIGWESGRGWGYQTRDNSFTTGGAYGFPRWALIYLDRRTNTRTAARDAIEELIYSNI